MKRVVWLAALLLPGIAQASCFEGQLPQAEWAAAAAASSLRLVVMQPGGKASGAVSGVVVAGSGSPNRVLTAGQTLRGAGTVPGGWIAAWSSSGSYLGRLEPAAEASAHLARRLSAQVMPSGVRPSDVAVLRMAQFSADGARRYTAIPGLSLALRQPVGVLAAVVSDPAGLDAGAAGAGVIGVDGRLLGVALPRAVGRAAPRVDVQAGDATGGRSRSVRLPLSAAAYAMPLSDPAILAALGRAGAGIAQARGPLREQTTIPAYAAGGCVVFRTAMAPP